LKAIFGMLEAALLWYKTFRRDLEDVGFISIHMTHVLPTKRSKDCNKQVDDLKSSHKMKWVNDRFEKWLNGKYSKQGRVTSNSWQGP
jgi:hypothetical protein